MHHELVLVSWAILSFVDHRRYRRPHTTSFQLLDKQPNFVFGLAGACADKIQLRFQKRSLAAAEPATFDDARFLRQAANELDINIMFFLSLK